MAHAGSSGTSARRGDRHGRRHLARAGAGGQLGGADRRPLGHSRHHPLPDRGAADDDRRHRRLRRRPSRSARRCSPSVWRCSPPRRRSARRAPAGPATSRARCSSRCRRSSSNGRSARRSPRPRARTTASPTGDLLERGRDRPLQALARSLPVRHRRRPHRRPLRHQGLADLAVDRLLLGRDRDPARRRGDPARRDRRRAVHRHRRLGARRSADPLLAAFGAVDPERSARGRRQAVLEEPRRLRHGRGRRGARARERRGGARARRRHPRLRARLRRDGRRLPPHPLEPGRGADHRRDPRGDRGRRPRRPTTSTTSTPTAPARPRTTRWSRWAAWR